MTVKAAVVLLQNAKFRCEEIEQHIRFGSPLLASQPLLAVLQDLEQIRLALPNFPMQKIHKLRVVEG